MALVSKGAFGLVPPRDKIGNKPMKNKTNEYM
jgi:hypothetical protein